MVKLKPIVVPKLKLRAKTTYREPNERSGSVAHYINDLCMELSWLDEWAVWNRGKQSITFLQINAKHTALTIENSVLIDFDQSTNSHAVLFRCSSGSSDVVLQFEVQPQHLINYVHSLLRSFQVSFVVTHKLSELVDQSNLSGVDVEEEPESYDQIKIEEITAFSTATTSSKSKNIKCIGSSDSTSLAPEVCHPKIEPFDVLLDCVVPLPTFEDEEILQIAEGDCDQGPPNKLKSGNSKRRVDRIPFKLSQKNSKSGLCRFCGETVPFSEASNHMLTKHDAKTECCFCPNSFETKKRFDRHIVMYHPRRYKPYGRLKCKVCHLFISRSESYDHMLVEHQTASECPFCEFHTDIERLPSEEAMKYINVIPFGVSDHIRRNHKFLSFAFPCTRCRKTFKTPKTLKKHEKSHVETPDQSDPRFNRKMCNLCGAKPFHLKKHQATKHGLNRDDVYKYKCTFCVKSYATSWHLRMHLLRNHLQDKKITCPKCPGSFASERLLEKHMTAHENPKIKCPQCDKLFKRKHNVVQHLQGKCGLISCLK